MSKFEGGSKALSLLEIVMIEHLMSDRNELNA